MLTWETTASRIRLAAVQMVETPGGASVTRTQATPLQDHMIILNDTAGHAAKLISTLSLDKVNSFYLPALLPNLVQRVM